MRETDISKQEKLEILQAYIKINMYSALYVKVTDYVTYAEFAKQNKQYKIWATKLTEISKRYPNELFSAITWLHQAIHYYRFESSILYSKINWDIGQGIISKGKLIECYRAYKAKQANKDIEPKAKEVNKLVNIRVTSKHFVTLTDNFLYYREGKIPLKDITVDALQSLCDTNAEFVDLFDIYYRWKYESGNLYDSKNCYINNNT